MTTHTSAVFVRPKSAPSEDLLIRASRILFYLGLFAVSLLVVRVGGFITIGDALLMLSAALLVFSPRDPTNQKPFGIGQGIALFAIVGGGCIASAVSPASFDSVQVLLRVLYVAMVLPWQARRLLDTPERLSAACTFFALGAAVCGLGTLVQSRLGAGAIPGADITTAGRYSGFTGHVSDTGGVTALAVVIGMAGLGTGTSRMTKFLSLGIIGGGLIGLVLCGSVSGMVSAAAGIIVILLLRGIGFGRLLLVVASAAAAVFAATSVIDDTQNALDPVERFNQALGLSGSMDTGLNTTASRLETDRLGWESFLQNPMTGVGLDPQSSIVEPLGNLAVHNFLIGALHQGGIIFALGILVAALRLIMLGVRETSRHSLSVRTLAMSAAAVAFCVTAPSFFNRYFWVPLALLATQAALAQRGLLTAAPTEALKEATIKQRKAALPSDAYRTLQRRQSSRDRL